MAKLDGQFCHVCKRKIEVASVAQWCSSCGKPVHEYCLSPVEPENANADYCSRCGAARQLELSPDAAVSMDDFDRSFEKNFEDETHGGKPPKSFIEKVDARTTSKSGKIASVVGALIGLSIAAIFLYQQFGQPTSKVEKTVREGMKNQFKIPVKSVQLTEQPDGTYKGIAITETGEEWDITNVTVKGKEVHWIQRPPQAQVERELRQTLESLLAVGITSLDLHKQPNGNYSGTADTARGIQYEVWQGTVLGSLESVIVANPIPADYAKWLRYEIETQTKSKIDSIQFVPLPNGNVGGSFAKDKGIKYDFRIGLPPGEVWNVDDPSIPKAISWQAAMSPNSYADWASAGIEEQLNVRVKSIQLKKGADGIHRGIAEAMTGSKYAVEVGDFPDPDKPKPLLGQINLPDFLKQPEFQPNPLPASKPAKLFRVKEGKWAELGPANVRWSAKPLAPG